MPRGVLLGSNAASAASAAPSGAAGGDLSGTYPNPTVAKLNGVAAASYALLASPALTGTPTVPTAAQGTNTTQAASTAMVQSEVTLLAPKASPTFTGTVTLPSGLVLPASVVIPSTAVATTQSASDNSTKVATTAYADTADALKLAKASNLSDLASASTARTNLGLGTAAVLPANVYDTEANIFALSAATYSGVTAYATDTLVLFRSDGSNWKPLVWAGATQSGTIGGLSNGDMNGIAVNTQAGAASGTERLVGIFIPRGFVVSTIKTMTGTTPATLGSNNDSHWYFLIRKQDGSLMASTADQGTGAIAASTVFSKAIARDSANSAAANWTCPASDYYLVGHNVYVGTGGSPVVPTWTGLNSLAATAVNGLGKIIAATGQSSMTSGTPATSASPANAIFQPWYCVL